MTDNEIIKALESCISGGCKTCPLYTYATGTCIKRTMFNAHDLINRQKAEIEKLKRESDDKERAYTNEYCLRKEWRSKCRELLEENQTEKSKAIKEFAERLKEKKQWDVDVDDYIFVADVDNLVREMTEVEE